MTHSALIAAGTLVVAVCGGLLSGAFQEALAASASPTPSAPRAAAHQIATSELPACLLGDWRHSHEEDTPDLRIYRPANYPFPPSRGRTGFAFFASGDVISYGIAPADGLLASRGQWAFTPPNLVTIALDDRPAAPETLVVASCAADLLGIAMP